MKTIFKIMLPVMCLFLAAACKSDPKEKSVFQKVSEASKNVSNANKLVKNAQKSQDLMKTLSEMEPISNEALKTWMPESLGNLERTQYKIGGAGYGNMSSIKLTYKDATEKNKSVRLEIIDGAGSGAGIVYTYRLADGIKVDSESNTGYERAVERAGTTIMETYKNKDYGNQSRMRFLFKDRFAVSATGFGMEPDELWSYLEKVRLDKLE